MDSELLVRAIKARLHLVITGVVSRRHMSWVVKYRRIVSLPAITSQLPPLDASGSRPCAYSLFPLITAGDGHV